MAAAIQLKRHGLAPLVFEKNRVGGLLLNAHRVENYPGFPGGIAGTDLACLMEDQLMQSGVEVIPTNVAAVAAVAGGFAVRTSRTEMTCRGLVVASGTRPKKLPGVEFPPEAGSRIHYDVLSLRERRGRRIAIVGGGDGAFDYALGLAGHNEVTILVRGERPECLQLLRERADASRSISAAYGTCLTSVEMDSGELVLGLSMGGSSSMIHADHLVVAIGREAEMEVLSGLGEQVIARLREQGLLHLIGDVTGGRMRQTAIAVGEGVKAAMILSARLGEGTQ
jgi:thioredoxin reductase